MSAKTKRTKKVPHQVYRFDLQHPYGVIFLIAGYGLAAVYFIINRNSPYFYFGLGLSSITLWLRTRKEIVYEEVDLEELANPKTLGEKILEVFKKWWDSIPSSRDTASAAVH